MTALLGALMALVALWAWLKLRAYERRERILGCTHEGVRVIRMRREYGGGVLTQCDECGYQAHLLDFFPLPSGAFHLAEGTDRDERERVYLAERDRHADWVELDAALARARKNMRDRGWL